MKPRFLNRIEAGAAVAGLLSGYAGRPDVVVVGLPRGGVPVAAEVARALHAPLDAFVVRKLGVPGHNELAMGAIASGDVVVRNEAVIAELGITDAEVAAVAEAERKELHRREAAYRSGRPPVAVEDRTVIVVDDGLATGASMRAALAALRRLGARLLVVAVPTAPEATVRDLRAEADEVVCVDTPHPFLAVGCAYVDFSPVDDYEVTAALAAT